jgi:hypothetical protein
MPFPTRNKQMTKIAESKAMTGLPLTSESVGSECESCNRIWRDDRVTNSMARA